jgi:hypothetical protein
VADREQLDIVLAGVEKWNGWLIDHANLAIDLRDADLSHRELDHIDLHGADMRNVNLRETSLAHANLAGANLARADLAHAYLGDSDLSNADLGEAIVRNASLHNANLSGARLGETDLRWANLEGAVLLGAYLGGANLNRAHVSNADFTDAQFQETIFGTIELAQVRGLDSSRHGIWPSVIDFQSLSGSKSLPHSFLRGVGLTDQLIESLPGFLGASGIRSVGQNTLDRTAVTINARRLDFLYGVLPAVHLSLVVREPGGSEYEYEGQPERQRPFNYGRIIVTKRPYRPRLDRIVLRVPLPPIDDSIKAQMVLESELERLNGANIAYDPWFGPNSNSIVRTILISLGLPPLQPAAVAPGFEYRSLSMVPEQQL